jgi:hypothetical protein
MAARRKPQARKVRFELTWSAIAGIAVVSFCIFLWMFLLGVWTGQSLLLPSPFDKTSMARQEDPKRAPEAAAQAADPLKASVP